MIAQDDWRRTWNLVNGSHSAVLVTIKSDGSLDSRPMGCLQARFEGTLWFITFRQSPKLVQIAANDHVLVSYARPSKHEYVSISGRARLAEDKTLINELWYEGLHVWFPKGPNDPELALIAVEIEAARYWTDSASFITYAWLYLRSRLTGKPAAPAEVVDNGYVRF
jgi:general stress protein 26